MNTTGLQHRTSLSEVRCGVFAYDFPHKKTQDILFRLAFHSVNIEAIFAMPRVDLYTSPTIRTKIQHSALLHPSAIAEWMGVPYYVLPHDNPRVVELIVTAKLDLGIIAGARILPKQVIDPFRIGVINFHPGLIPESRGLDAMLWSIHNDIPLGVTAHLIDQRVDSGSVLIRSVISIFADDEMLDLSERLYDTQVELLLPAIEAAVRGDGKPVVTDNKYNRQMSSEMQKHAFELLPAYIDRHKTTVATDVSPIARGSS